MLSARQLLFMRRARDRTIGVAIAPIGTVALLPDPDFRRRVLRCVGHVGLSRVARWVGRMDRVDYQYESRLPSRCLANGNRSLRPDLSGEADPCGDSRAGR